MTPFIFSVHVRESKRVIAWVSQTFYLQNKNWKQYINYKRGKFFTSARTFFAMFYSIVLYVELLQSLWLNQFNFIFFFPLVFTMFLQFQQQSSLLCYPGSSPFEQQQLSIPCCAAKALDQLHATVSLQVLSGVLRHVPTDLQVLEVVKVWAAQFPQPSRCRSVALPGLRLQQEVLADVCQAGEQPQQARVSVVQVDPHGDSQTQAQVESGAAVLNEVRLQLLSIFADVQWDKGDVPGQRVGLLRPLNEHLVQVEAQEVNVPPIWVFFTLGLLH